MDLFVKYLIIINIVAFVIFTIDFFIYIKGGDGVPEGICTYVTIFGGALGVILAFLIFDRNINKQNMTWRIFAIAMLIVQIVIVLGVYGPFKEIIKDSLNNFWIENRIVICYLAFINILTFIMFTIDKWKAKNGKWRIRIASLLGLSAIGGSIGGLASMYLFRHKTKKAYFTIGIPMIMVAQVTLLVYAKICKII